MGMDGMDIHYLKNKDIPAKKKDDGLQVNNEITVCRQ